MRATLHSKTLSATSSMFVQGSLESDLYSFIRMRSAIVRSRVRRGSLRAWRWVVRERMRAEQDLEAHDLARVFERGKSVVLFV